MRKVKLIQLLDNKPIPIEDKVSVTIPTVRQANEDPLFLTSSLFFTITNRELFATSRQIEELCRRFPSMYEIMIDPEADKQIGGMFLPGLTMSQVCMASLSYWTGLEMSGEEGFVKLTNGKIAHVGAEWVIDSKEFIAFQNLIKTIVSYEGPSMGVPTIETDSQYERWMNLYRGRMKSRKNKGMTYVDKMLVLATSMESYIPFEQILEMNVFSFNTLLNAVNRKDLWKLQMGYHLSQKFDTSKQQIKYWKDGFKINNYL